MAAPAEHPVVVLATWAVLVAACLPFALRFGSVLSEQGNWL
jgi:hypothetical protein